MRLRQHFVTHDLTAAKVDKAASTVGSGTTYGGMLAAIYGWLASADAAIIIGVFFTIAGFLVNYFFARRRHLRETEEHEWRRLEHRARMRAIMEDKSDAA